MIIEGVVTTENSDGSVNIAPMGPRTDPSLARLLLRPFPTSDTFQNLRRTGRGIFHITDDAELIARAAIGKLETQPKLIAAPQNAGWIIADACRWLAFEARSIDESGPRVEIDCEVVARETVRDFLGFNRAKHALIEGAILATRIGILPGEKITADFASLEVIVDKTAGEAERRAWAVLRDYVRRRVSGES